MDLRGRARTCRGAAGTGWGTFPPRSMCATSNTDGSRRSILPANRSPQVCPASGLGGCSYICRRSCGRAVQPSPSRVLVSRVLVRSEPSREPEEQSQDPSRATPHKRETNSLIDGPGPRATSGQGRAYSAARGDRDSPDRPAPSANNSPARCTISKPRRRNLTLHSKIARPSKCSYRLKCFRRSWFLVVSYPARGAHKHYTSNNRLAEVRFPCAKSLSIDLPPNKSVNAACSLDARSPLHRNSFYARSIWVRCDAQPRNTGAQF